MEQRTRCFALLLMIIFLYVVSGGQFIMPFSEMEGGLAISALFLLQDKQKREFWGGKEVSGRKHCQKTCGEKEIRNASSLSEFIFSISIISIFNDSTFLF
eukprot:GEMP01097169.1.p1 GENE.GEMP01097169.1~~GEMP01097169.1.p1  ORF type:complete len:100 (+),score=2.46 GEMP01097169.1:502-801(+)